MSRKAAQTPEEKFESIAQDGDDAPEAKVAVKRTRKDGSALVVPWTGQTSDMQFVLNLVEVTVRKVVDEMEEKKQPGAILCFLPGWAEIKELLYRLGEGKEGHKMWALPLHSAVPKEQQRLVFKEPPKGRIKVILATNIAESSITIGDVTTVIDTGLERELTYDAKRRMSSMETVWVSQSSAAQRKGRAGRVQDGKVIRLYSREHLDILPFAASPEMLRCDLAQCCLQAIALGRDPRRFLADAIDPPTVAAVEVAMEQLLNIDAVQQVSSSGLSDKAYMMLPVGEVIARLPLDPLLGRAAMLGSMLGLPEASALMLIVANSDRQPWLLTQKDEVLSRRIDFCDSSDVVAAARAVMAWETEVRLNGEAGASRWASDRMMNPNVVSVLSKDKATLLRDLSKTNLIYGLSTRSNAVDEDETGTALLETREDMELKLEEAKEESEQEDVRPVSDSLDAENEELLTVVLCSAFPANIALRPLPQSNQLRTGAVMQAGVASHSVNGPKRSSTPDPGASWLMFVDLQISRKSVVLVNTTKLKDWHVALLGGLKARDLPSSDKGITLQLDGWLEVGGISPSTGELLKVLRQEIREAFTWQALAALHAGTDSEIEEASEAAVHRVRSAIFLLAGLKPPSFNPKKSTLEPVATSPKAQQLKDSAPSEARAKSEAAPLVEGGRGPGHQSKDLTGQTAASLKEMCKKLGLKVSGTKAQLIARLEEALSVPA